MSVKLDRIAIGKRIDKARIDKGLSKGGLARKIGIAPGTLSRYLSGDQAPDRDVLPVMSSVLGISQDEILHGSVKKDTEPPQSGQIGAGNGESTSGKLERRTEQKKRVREERL